MGTAHHTKKITVTVKVLKVINHKFLGVPFHEKPEEKISISELI